MWSLLNAVLISYYNKDIQYRDHEKVTQKGKTECNYKDIFISFNSLLSATNMYLQNVKISGAVSGDDQYKLVLVGCWWFSNTNSRGFILFFTQQWQYCLSNKKNSEIILSIQIN